MYASICSPVVRVLRLVSYFLLVLLYHRIRSTCDKHIREYRETLGLYQSLQSLSISTFLISQEDLSIDKKKTQYYGPDRVLNMLTLPSCTMNALVYRRTSVYSVQSSSSIPESTTIRYLSLWGTPRGTITSPDMMVNSQVRVQASESAT